jgi:hypothetical protein
MNEFDRAMNFTKAVFNDVKDRIQKLEESGQVRLAKDELERFLRPGQTVEETAISEPNTVYVNSMEPRDLKAEARRILGVAPEASFSDIHRAFVSLSEKVRPDQFPDNEAERKQAEGVQARVQWAYHTLSADISEVERRFKTLEIE